MERQTFISLFKDLTSRLYDRVAIETHPLATFFPVPEASSTRRAEVVQQLILKEIENLVKWAKCNNSFKRIFGRVYYDIKYVFEYEYRLEGGRGWKAFKEFFDDDLAARLQTMKAVCENIVIIREETN